MKDLKEKVIVVTGSAQGLGAAICTTLAKSGAKIMATDIKEEKLANIKKDIEKSSGFIREYRMII